MDTTVDIPTDADLLDSLQRRTFEYFLHEERHENGLVRDRTREGSPASIAATGFALSAYTVGVERGLMQRTDACQRTLAALRFFSNSEQSEAPNATGYRGFYYHFLDMETGRRAWKCELSTIDTALLIAGILTVGTYFSHDTPQEKEIRALSDALYRRVDWQWAQNDGAAVSLGWVPKRGFLPYRWEGYSEALILYVLALGSPSFPVGPEAYAAWTAGHRWKTIYGREMVYAGPLFIHQFSHIWLDLRGIQDAYMRGKGSDYFQNSRQATYAQRDYAIRNPRGFREYDANCWGLTASDGPGPLTRRIDGRERRFYSYRARGAPYGPDDGTLSPWSAVASLPFAPEIVLPTIRHFHEIDLKDGNPYGFTCSFNPTLAENGDPIGWASCEHVGINQGPIPLMIENHRTGFLWKLMRGCPHIVRGLRRASFTGGWLS
ncbi:glucoamylase family protein [Corticibacterium sp. UT-5YL-CI-8]|nr:glucoamylase family protein [Tianweitania sp. UT-5YL-CI-8]